MSDYIPPIRDMAFVIDELCDLPAIAELPDFAEQEVSTDLATAILEEAGKLAGEVLSPINHSGDREGCHWNQDGITTAKGFADAYRKFAEGGWNGLSAPEEYGGQGLPELLNTATHEMWNGANTSFALCPILTASAILCLKKHATETLQNTYLEKLVSGEWTGTMVLTEPQAGSDLSNVKCKAVPTDNHYRLHGQKIFITWGEHDMTDNIIHMVLARLPGAPPGVKGISLFLVPKFLVDEAGNIGRRNDVHCISIEHKMGIHASPTCTMAFGENDGAVGYLVGQPNQGLFHMFTMMNEARLKVGVQGLAIAERAYQRALAFAGDRVQGFPMKGMRSGERVTIINHPDVRRMLMTIKAQVEAMRAFNYMVASCLDQSEHATDDERRRHNETRLNLLIPVAKAWSTELGAELAYGAIQIYGGMGFMEETGATQYARDARIITIYEGTTGIQAADLVGRKLVMDRGEAMNALIADIRNTVKTLSESRHSDLLIIARSLADGCQALADATETLNANSANPAEIMAVSVPYLMLTGYVCGGWQMARAAAIAAEKHQQDPQFYGAKVMTARFYAEQILPKSQALAATVKNGGASTLALAEGQF